MSTFMLMLLYKPLHSIKIRIPIRFSTLSKPTSVFVINIRC